MVSLWNPAIILCSAKLLRNPSPIIEGSAPLSTGKSEDFRVKLRELETRLHYYSGFDSIYLSIDDIISQNGINDSQVNILLLGDEINTAYFSEKLLKKFPNVKGVEADITKDALKYLFIQISNNDYKLQVQVNKATVSNFSSSISNSSPTNQEVSPSKVLPLSQVIKARPPLSIQEVNLPPQPTPLRQLVNAPPPPLRQVVNTPPPPSRQVVNVPPPPPLRQIVNSPPPSSPPSRQVVNVPPPPPPPPRTAVKTQQEPTRQVVSNSPPPPPLRQITRPPAPPPPPPPPPKRQ